MLKSIAVVKEGKLGLYEDERLFINMIHRLNEQVMDTAQEEGADVDTRKERRQGSSLAIQGNRSASSPPVDSKMGGESLNSSMSSMSTHSAAQVSTLRSLVEENSMNKSSKEGLARVQEQDSLVANTVQAAEALAGMTAFSKREVSDKSRGSPAKRARTK